MSLVRLLPALILVAALGITGLAWNHERQVTQKALQSQFDFLLRETIGRVEQRMATYEQMLRGVQGLLAITEPTDRDAFSNYVGALQFDPNFASIQAVGIIKRVPAALAPSHVASMRRLGFNDYVIQPAGVREVYAPVIQREPYVGRNRMRPGFDAWSDPVRRSAMERARDSGMAAISGKVQLVVDSGADAPAGFVMYMPIYTRGQAQDNLAGRRAHLAGWIFASFRMSDVIASLYGEKPPGLAFSLFDGVEPTEAALLYRAAETRSRPAAFAANEYLVVGGNTWTLSVRSQDDFETRFGRNSALIIAATGVSLGLLLALLTWLILTARTRALQLAANMTQEIRESEARFRDFFEKNSSVMLLIDPTSGEIKEANETAATYYGYPRTQLAGMLIDEINTLPPERVAEERQKALHEERNYFLFQHRLASGELRDVEVHSSPVVSGGRTLLFSIAHDVTARKQAEQRVVETLRSSEKDLEGRVNERTAELSSTIERLKQTQVDLAQADKLASLGALVAGVAHELNTPIGNALTMASALEEAAIELDAMVAAGGLRRSVLAAHAQKSKGMAAIVTRSCLRAASLIASFKRVAVDQTSEQRRKFDLHALVDDNVAAIKPSFKKAPWIIEVDIRADIGCDSYPGPLGQVITNLIQNAAAHAFDGRTSGTLRVYATCDAEMVEMIVEDDGKGMEPAVLAHIFEPFYTTKLGQGGSGLGLSVSLNIVTGVLGGTLQASSDPGYGSRFTLRFPRIAPSQVAQPRKDRRRREQPSEG